MGDGVVGVAVCQDKDFSGGMRALGFINEMSYDLSLMLTDQPEAIFDSLQTLENAYQISEHFHVAHDVQC